jgi:hypothetical protein
MAVNLLTHSDLFRAGIARIAVERDFAAALAGAAYR